MPFKKSNESQLRRNDIARVLDMEEKNLSADICSKLRQNRYKAIDHAGIIDKRDYVRDAIGWTLATAASFAIVVFLFNNQHIIDKQTKITVANFIKEKGVFESDIHRMLGVPEEEHALNKLHYDKDLNTDNPAEPSLNEENNQLQDDAEDLEIYEWLYNNYG